MHQSNTEPREAPKRQGKRTHEQQKRIAEKRENTKGADVPMPGDTLAEAAKRHPRQAGAYDISSGDRSIQRGINDEQGHHKRRTDD